MEEKDILKKLENEVRAAAAIEAAKKAYKAELNQHLENEVRAHYSVENAKDVYNRELDKHLEYEVRARYTIDKAHEDFVSITGLEPFDYAHKTTGHTISLPYWKYITSVAAACIIGVIVFQADNLHTISVGETMFENCRYKAGNTIVTLISNEEYDQALEHIERGLDAIPNLEEAPEDVKRGYLKQRNILLEQKAIVLLRQGEHRKAKAVLQELDSKEAKEALDQLWWCW